ncbi:MAG TPA: hypothetical protein VEX11_02240, partial [Acetobacteraceae bacterium]|nr:hypothetical protein [Acetobacteraceae bacterium]
MPDARRVVEVKSTLEGSGYLIAPRLILTARHVVWPPPGQVAKVEVRILRRYLAAVGAERIATEAAEVVWPPADQGEPVADLDFALLHLLGPGLQVPLEAWGELGTWGMQKVEAVGFPSWAVTPEGHVRRGLPEGETGAVSGTVALGDELKALLGHDTGGFEVRV